MRCGHRRRCAQLTIPTTDSEENNTRGMVSAMSFSPRRAQQGSRIRRTNVKEYSRVHAAPMLRLSEISQAKGVKSHTMHDESYIDEVHDGVDGIP